MLHNWENQFDNLIDPDFDDSPIHFLDALIASDRLLLEVCYSLTVLIYNISTYGGVVQGRMLGHIG